MTDRSSRPILPQIWLKAAMLGSLWASVEIVLGSFLHNIRLPFSGTILAALGVIIMINGYKLWPDQGLFWRTALVTALMKSISPSAVIFGPMIGIFMEGVLLEFCTRVFRRHWLGFVIGGALAVTWSLFQKIFVLLLTYGPDFVVLYEQLYFMAVKILRIQGSVPIDLVKLLFILDMSFGALVAGIAWNTRAGRSKQSDIMLKDVPLGSARSYLTAAVTQKYSFALLFFSLAALIGGLLILNDLPTLPGLILVLGYVAFNVFRYSKSLNRLRNPKLWIQLMLLMSLSGLLLGGWSDVQTVISGLMIGLNMAVRALLVIFSFSALSIELRNPRVIQWFTEKGMGVLFESVSLAFEVLPLMLKLVGEDRGTWRHPFKTLLQLLASLEVLRIQHARPLTEILFVTGEQGAGKTQLINRYLASSAAKELKIRGILTDGVWVGDERDHYFVRDLHTGQRELLCERDGPTSEIQAGPFNFRELGFTFGNDVLRHAIESSPDLIIIDEIGHLERYDQGWSQKMTEMVQGGQTMIWSVRPSLLDEIAAKWPIDYNLFSADDANEAELGAAIKTLLKTH